MDDRTVEMIITLRSFELVEQYLDRQFIRKHTCPWNSSTLPTFTPFARTLGLRRRALILPAWQL